MGTLRIVLSAVCVLGALTIATAAEAQCGTTCGACPNPLKQSAQGRGGTEGYQVATCSTAPCPACSEPLVGASLPVADILRTVGSAALADLEGIVKEHRDHLALSRDRNLVAVLEKACGGAQAVTAVLVVSPERAEALERLGVKHFAEFLGEPDTAVRDEARGRQSESAAEDLVGSKLRGASWRSAAADSLGIAARVISEESNRCHHNRCSVPPLEVRGVLLAEEERAI